MTEEWFPHASTWVSVSGDDVQEVFYDRGIVRLSDGSYAAFTRCVQVPEPEHPPPQLASLRSLLIEIQFVRDYLPQTETSSRAAHRSRAALSRIEAYIRMTKQ